MIKVRTGKQARVCQGDIFKDVEMIEYAVEKAGVIEISKIQFPIVIVLTQDCDLAQDYMFRWSRANTKTQDKWLISVLVAPLYNAEHLFRGEHLSELDMKMMDLENGSKTHRQKIRSNQDQRFHYVEFPDQIPIVPSVIDFKHYFSVNGNYLKGLKKSHFVCRVSELYREDISQRFASFLARIGLPN